MRFPELSECEISLVVEQDWTDPSDYFDTIGVPELQAELDRILDSPNIWDWCAVTVCVSYGDWHGEASLGACSYASEADFRADAYFTDLCAEALEHLHEEIRSADAALAKLRGRR